MAHAEAMDLAAAGEAARGATVVCTLEPCSHHGRTPPCTDALVAAGVARVVIGCPDPLERERDQGREVLRAAGIDVALADGDEARECAELNAAFLTWSRTGLPHVTLKLATSLDGKIATAAGESRWISGLEARALVHRWRADHDAVAVGIGTALADDPALTARDVEGPVRQPARVVFDSTARLPLRSALAHSAGEAPVLVVAAEDAPPTRVAALEAVGVEVVRVPGAPRERIVPALRALGERGIQSLLVEGGAGLAAGLVAAGAVDRVAWFLAPILIGGRESPSALGGGGAAALAEAPRLEGLAAERVGGDLLVTGRLRPLPGGEG
jgi:diaminohydroxyphosphoribosylaminopyrimidine deaminase/5-amino-6-(5-phosphoribosylamino)uracil reductase